MNEQDPIIWRDELTAMCRKSGETVRRWIKSGRLPTPDVKLSARTMGWKLSTLRAANINLSVPPRETATTSA